MDEWQLRGSHFHLELCHHSLLRVIGSTSSVEKSSRQVHLVIPLKLVLVV